MKKLILLFTVFALLISLCPASYAQGGENTIDAEQTLKSLTGYRVWQSNASADNLTVKKDSRWTVSIPKNPGQISDIIFFYNGAVNDGVLFATDSQAEYSAKNADPLGWYQEEICDYIAQQNPGTIIAVPRICYGDSTVVDEIFGMINSLGISVKTACVAGWSNGGAGVITTSARIAKCGYAERIKMLMADSNYTADYAETWRECADYGIELVYLSEDASEETISVHNLQSAADVGITLIMIAVAPNEKGGESVHTGYKITALEDNLPGCLLDSSNYYNIGKESGISYSKAAIYENGMLIEISFNELVNLS